MRRWQNKEVVEDGAAVKLALGKACNALNLAHLKEFK